MTKYRIFIFAAAVLLVVNTTGCKSNNQEASAPATKQPVTVQPQAEQGAPQATPEKSVIEGKVTETMDAGGYTYVNVETKTGPVWVAMPQAKVEVGQDISLAGGMEMSNFESKTLGRTFDSVIFSSGIMAPGETAGSAATGGESFADAMQGEAANEAVQPTVSSGGSQAAMAEAQDVMVEKAEGENAYTVGELFAKKADLDQKKVKVRGKVVKVSMGIMGKNWLHIQDGTGEPSAKTHDLVVTTQATPEKGSTVVVEGVLNADKDFGSGYRYDAIIEDAEVK